jgi:hypothetical protein
MNCHEENEGNKDFCLFFIHDETLRVFFFKIVEIDENKDIITPKYGSDFVRLRLRLLL